MRVWKVMTFVAEVARMAFLTAMAGDHPCRLRKQPGCGARGRTPARLVVVLPAAVLQLPRTATRHRLTVVLS